MGDWPLAVPNGAPLLQRWLRWQLRAESFLRELAKGGCVTEEGAGERNADSSPTVRPAAPAGAHRQQEPVEPVALRRLT